MMSKFCKFKCVDQFTVSGPISNTSLFVTMPTINNIFVYQEMNVKEINNTKYKTWVKNIFMDIYIRITLLLTSQSLHLHSKSP